ncbi:MAG: hypothetical protein ABH856_01800 [Patescibacteria group bacterium]|nr:hypothetical protein [Patescibacteria group bacterium]
MDQNPPIPPAQQPPPPQAPQATQTVKPPLGIKLMAGILLFIGLVIGVDVLSSISAILVGGWAIVLGAIALVLFIFTEKTAIGMFKLKPNSKRNYYIAVVLDMLYLSAKPSMGLFLLTKEVPSVQTLLAAIMVAITGAVILSLAFFLIAKKHEDLYATPASQDWKAIVAVLIAIAIIGGGGVYFWQQEESAETTEAPKVIEAPEVIETPEVPQTFDMFGGSQFDTVVTGYLKTQEEEIFGEKTTTAYLVITDFDDNNFQKSIEEGIERGNTVNNKENDNYLFNLGCFKDNAIEGKQRETEPYLDTETQEAILQSSPENPVTVRLYFDYHEGMGCICCDLAHVIRVEGAENTEVEWLTYEDSDLSFTYPKTFLGTPLQEPSDQNFGRTQWEVSRQDDTIYIRPNFESPAAEFGATYEIQIINDTAAAETLHQSITWGEGDTKNLCAPLSTIQVLGYSVCAFEREVDEGLGRVGKYYAVIPKLKDGSQTPPWIYIFDTSGGMYSKYINPALLSSLKIKSL